MSYTDINTANVVAENSFRDFAPAIGIPFGGGFSLKLVVKMFGLFGYSSYLWYTKEGKGAQPQPRRITLNDHNIMQDKKYTPEEAIKVAEQLVAEIRDFEQRSGINYYRPTDADMYSKYGDELGAIACDIEYQYTAYMSSMVRGIYNGAEPEIVTAWRYGKVPERGTSYNYRDQEYERGVSVLPYEGGKESAYYKAFFGSAPLIRVRGVDLGYKGGDGEPLLFAAEEITD